MTEKECETCVYFRVFSEHLSCSGETDTYCSLRDETCYPGDTCDNWESLK